MASSVRTLLSSVRALFTRSTAARIKTTQLAVETLEERTNPSLVDLNPAPVWNTDRFPNSATVQLDAVWDTNNNDRLDASDAWYTSSGAMISKFHVLTAGHSLYDNNASTSISGYADWIFVHAGRKTKDSMPWGEAKGVNWYVPSQWQNGGANAYKYDLGVVALDRNLGTHTGWYGVGYLGDWFFKGKGTIDMLHYPGEDGHDGKTQYYSSGTVAKYDADTFSYNHDELYTAKGSSGAPVMVSGVTVNGQVWKNVIIGVHVRGNHVVNSATRIDKDWYDYIQDTMKRNTAPTDKADLVDYDTWFSRADASLSKTRVKGSESFSVTAKVFNAGTKSASNVKVTFRLSRDGTYDTSDKLLGSVTISSLGAFKTGTAKWTGKLPSGIAKGSYTVVWSIDPDNTVNEFVPSGFNKYRGVDVDFGRTSKKLTVA